MTVSQYSDGTYLENHPTWDLEHAPFKARHVAKMIRRNNLRPETMADIGCGNGGVLANLKREFPNCQMYGFDISPQAIEMGRQLHGPSIELACSNPFDDPRRFDIALGMDVIEHVEDLFGFLQGIKALAPYKIFHIPLEINSRWVMQPDMYANANRQNGHIHFFNTEIALATLAWAGYDVIDSVLTPHAIELASTPKAKLASLPRRIVAALDPQLANRLFGGWSLLVLAK